MWKNRSILIQIPAARNDNLFAKVVNKNQAFRPDALH